MAISLSNVAFAQMTREEYRQELEAYRQTAKQNEVIFLDKTQPTEQRLKAVQDIEIFTTAEDKAACLDIVMDIGQPDAIRAAGLMKVRHAAHKQEAVRTKVLNWMGQSSTPPKFRKSCMNVMQMAYVNPNTQEAVREEITAVFHKLLLDAKPAAREKAFFVLSAYGDDQAHWLLVRGLQEPMQALLPIEKSVPLLAMRKHDSDYHLNVIYEALQKTSNQAAQIECIKALGNYQPARPDIIRLLNDKKQSLEVRRASMQSLNHGNGQEFLSIAKPIITDENAPESLRIYALQAETYRELSRKMNTANTTFSLDNSFQQVIEQVRSTSSEAVKNTLRDCCRKLGLE